MKPLDAAPLPPPFRALTLRETGDAFATACALAAREGAGALVRTGRFDTIELALVVEPDGPPHEARRGFFICMGAAAAALRAYLPPEHGLAVGWPDRILVEGLDVGRGRLGWRMSPAGDALDWLVFGVEINGARVVAPDGAPAAMSLEEAGFETFDGATFAADFARQLLLAQDRLEHDGFAAAAAPYLELLDLGKAGLEATLDAGGDLALRRPGAAAGPADIRPWRPVNEAPTSADAPQ